MTDDEEKTRWITHGGRTVYDNRWIKLSLVDVELPDGHRFEHHVASLKAAAVVVILDSENRVLLLWRHRFVADRWGWELPGGLVDEGEAPLSTASREIEEETGLRPKSLTHLVSFQPMVGMVDSEHHVYLTRDPEYVSAPMETTEASRMEWVPLTDVPAMITSGKIWSSGTLVGLLHVLADV
ncbi:NUDIX hydrolase [Actinomadura sp. 7K507]|uniref:NUDIX hydrolase n=1 Tax=Actinomadura sp. 7K507 TaxID=2530365 RepID=UPI001044A9F1|nr:NUDIX hydrolase [Actinomadura sp. 7K507]TDC73902.1 NUDIX hydrolase [Actinomadura sp. 7K507]